MHKAEAWGLRLQLGLRGCVFTAQGRRVEGGAGFGLVSLLTELLGVTFRCVFVPCSEFLSHKEIRIRPSLERLIMTLYVL